MIPVHDRAITAFADDVGSDGPVSVQGCRTRWNLGGSLADGTRLVWGPAGIVEHRPEEMTVRVRTGTPVRELDAALRSVGQHTALPDRGGTVGGAVAVGESHLDVLRRGTVRASVLEVRYVAADGRVVRGGGPTVKNVSGFDLPRLMVGALGTLGLLADVVLRTNPIPRASMWVAGRCDPFAMSLRLIPRTTLLWDGVTSWIHLQGHPRDVAAQRAALGSGWNEAAGPPDLPPHRWSMKPSDLRNLPTTEGHRFVVSIGVGLAFLPSPQPPRSVGDGARLLGARAKAEFDPAGRLNPGRDPARR